MLMRKLPVIDLLLLGEYDGKPIDYELSFTKIEKYGQDYKRRVESLVADGYLACYSSEGNLGHLTIPELKEILRRHNQKLSGKKDELIARIIENIPAENYVRVLPKIYSATAQGCRELSTRYAYIENQKMQYGFLNSEITAIENELETEGNLTADAVLEKLFLNNIVKYGSEQNYGLLRNTYYGLSRYLKKRGRLDESLRSLLSVIYYDLSGMSNNNFIQSYDSLSYVFETSLWNEIDKLRTTLNFSDEDLTKLFDEAVDLSVKVPFSYFDTSTLKKIILDRLHGEINLMQKYENFSNKPPEISYEYAFDAPEEVPKKNYKIWLSLAVIILSIVALAAFWDNKSSTVQVSQTTEPQKTAVNVPKENDALQNLFAKISLDITDAELEKYIAGANLEYTKQDTAPKQYSYKIAYKKSDTYRTRSTGGDYVEVSFESKTNKCFAATYYNSKSSIELLMTGSALHGHKSDGRSGGYYYLHDITNYGGLDNAEDCYSADNALTRLKVRLAQ